MYETKIRVSKSGKVVPIHGMKAYKRNGDIEPLVRNVGTG
jgi:hypothetical protein